LEINQTHKSDFALLTLETGHRSTKMMDKLRAEGNRLEWVRKSGVIARILDLPRVAHSEGLKGYEKTAIRLWGSHRPPRTAGRSALVLREYRPSDLDDCLELLGAYRNSVTLSLVWDREELGRELAYPEVSRTLVYERDGRLVGLVNFLAHDHLGRTTERWAWINHLAYPGLTKAERFEFVQAYLRTVRDDGFVGTVEWKRNYYPMDAFRRSRFFPYPRAVNLVSWTFNPALSLARIPDVYEIQV
jgi:hypothetical protein